MALRRRVRRTVEAVRQELHDALHAEHSPRQVAASFAIGVFITALPTLGLGVLTFFAFAYLFTSISKIALFASVLVLNPVVKWGVYASSFWLGSLLLGPVDGVTATQVSLSAAPNVVARLLIGNLLVAVVLVPVAYVCAHRLTVRYRGRSEHTGPFDSSTEQFRTDD